jgi:hypothetical protein
MSTVVQFTCHFAIERHSDLLVELSRSIHTITAIDQQREFAEACVSPSAEADHEQRSRLLANRTESRSGFVGGTR